MMNAMSPAISRFAALGLLLALILGLGGYVLVPAVQRTMALGEEIASKREVLGRLLAHQNSSPVQGEAAGSIDRALAADLTVQGETEPIRLAALQAAVRGLAGSAGVRLESTRTLPPVLRAQIQLSGLQVSMRASVDALQRLLHGIEVHRPIMIVDGLDIVPIPAGSGNENGDDRLLRIELRVLAYTGAVAKGAEP
jgi:hypothetical protein